MKRIIFVIFVILLWFKWKRSPGRALATSQAENPFKNSAPEQETNAGQNSKFDPLFDFEIPIAEIRKQQEKEAITNPGNLVSRKKRTAEPEPELETTYGLLYNNQVVRSDKNINPIGTKLPASQDYWDLKNYIEAIEGQATDILNSLGFKIKYAGYRFNDIYQRFGEDTDGELTFWTSYYSSQTDTQGRFRIQYPDSFGLNGEPIEEKNGFSIRLLVENPENWTEGDTYTDADGNVYQTVKIGNQVWLNENLKTTKFIDGTPIILGHELIDWQVDAPRYCYPSGDINNV